jgi:hypothetical protein
MVEHHLFFTRCFSWRFYRIQSGEESDRRRAMYPDPQRLEDISKIRDAMRQISQEAEAVVGLLDLRIENEHLDGRTEAEDVRSVLELIQNLSLEVSEELDAYQERHIT